MISKKSIIEYVSEQSGVKVDYIDLIKYEGSITGLGKLALISHPVVLA